MSKRQFASAAEAEAAFYEALAQGDLDAVMGVWCTHEDVVCIHPGGARLDGYEVIREGWRLILAQGKLRFRITDVKAYEGMLFSVRTLCEWVADASNPDNEAPVFATNTYLLTDHGWRMVAHHASAAPTAPETESEGPVPGTLLH